MNDTKKSAKRTTGRNTSSNVWTDEERAAMVEHAAEMKAGREAHEGRGGRRGRPAREDRRHARRPIGSWPSGSMPSSRQSAPDLAPRTYYGMPAYGRDGKVVCFFQPAAKFKARYATIGFEDKANLDDGGMWPTAVGG